jgi:glutamate-ammonia-ligase adenylyltransferase
MSIAARQTRCPDPFEPERGDDAVAALPGLDAALVPLIKGTAGCSPYLAGLIASEADWLPGALDAPETAVTDLLECIPEIALDQLPAGLRQAKRRIALIAALADLSGVWPLEQVTQALSDFADAAVHACLVALVGAEIKRGKLPGDPDPQTAGGMTVLAMGKMGAGELNYSSDIDLICLFDETRFDPDDYHDARASFIRARGF